MDLTKKFSQLVTKTESRDLLLEEIKKKNIDLSKRKKDIVNKTINVQEAQSVINDLKSISDINEEVKGYDVEIETIKNELSQVLGDLGVQSIIIEVNDYAYMLKNKFTSSFNGLTTNNTTTLVYEMIR